MGVDAGEQKYGDGDSVPHTLGSDAAVAGDAVAISSADGQLVLTTGDNGFVGVLGTNTATEQTQQRNRPVNTIGDGSEVTLQLQGVVRAKVSATIGATVSAGEQLVADANGALTNVDDGTGTATQAGVGDMQPLTDEDSEGFALVRLV